MELVKSIGTITSTLITNKELTKCFEIDRTLHEASGEKAIMISLFPTLGSKVGDAFVVDKTTQHLISHMSDLNLKSVKIVNLFSKIYRGSRLSSRNLKVDVDNLEYIETLFKRKDFHEYKVILAYGSSMSTSFACRETKRTLLNLFQMYNPDGKLYQLTTNNLSSKNQEAIHVLYMGIRFSNIKWRLEEFHITQEKLAGKAVNNSTTAKTEQILANPKKKKEIKNVS